jgi:hypothetical protein
MIRHRDFDRELKEPRIEVPRVTARAQIFIRGAANCMLIVHKRGPLNDSGPAVWRKARHVFATPLSVPSF